MPKHLIPGLILSAGFCSLCAMSYLIFDSVPQAPDAPVATKAEPASRAWGASPFAVGAPTDGSIAARPGNAPRQPIYGRNGRQVDFGGENAADYIAQWSALARNGDAAAAYKVFQAADVCANNDEPVPPFGSATERDEFLRERDNLNRLCEGVSAAQVQERMVFLNLAARAGNRDAQIDYFMEGPDGKPYDAAIDDPALLRWKSDSITFLKSASAQGDAFALGLLANAYDAGQIVESDPKMSLAYTMANAAARHVDLTPDQLRARFGSQMSDDDFAAAIQMGRQISALCCQK
ncbi:MAG TPA: hypothetical protein VIF60_13570 [Burkholderiaceae bacterium]|jgi:hypothetical protein